MHSIFAVINNVIHGIHSHQIKRSCVSHATISEEGNNKIGKITRLHDPRESYIHKPIHLTSTEQFRAYSSPSLTIVCFHIWIIAPFHKRKWVVSNISNCNIILLYHNKACHPCACMDLWMHHRRTGGALVLSQQSKVPTT